MTPKAAAPQQAALIERLRALLGEEPSTREVSMFGVRSFMVNDKLLVSARKDGALLVRVPAEQHDTLIERPGARQAQMGPDRDMGPGWIEVGAASVSSDEELAFWLGIALDSNRTGA